MPTCGVNKCSIEWCTRPSAHRGKYCPAHYMERSKYGKFLSLEERAANKKKCAKKLAEVQKANWADPVKHAIRAKKMRIAGLAKHTVCTVPGCMQRARGLGLCPKHRHHNKKYGGPLVGPTRPRRGTGTQAHHAGYEQVRKLDHPGADHHGYVMEHRLVMEQHLGRRLKRAEVVHHKDGNVKNNSLGNLVLFANQSEHQKAHSKVRLKKFGSYGFEEGRDRVLREKKDLATA